MVALSDDSELMAALSRLLDLLRERGCNADETFAVHCVIEEALLGAENREGDGNEPEAC